MTSPTYSAETLTGFAVGLLTAAAGLAVDKADAIAQILIEADLMGHDTHIPTGDTPVLIDISTSATTNGLTGRLHHEGRRLPAPWVIDGHGRPSDDPAVLFAEPKGTILPLGGIDSGVALYPTILPMLEPWAGKLGIAMPLRES